MTELENGDLQLEDGTVIPAEKRQKCEVYSRVVGYMRPVSSWNKGQKAMWHDRALFEVKNAVDIDKTSV
jgi:anaerobic ribonucleoside-triphosphate reductase